MAEKGWTTRVAVAAGAAAGTGAAQLGLGYGLGVIVWPMTATDDDSVWLGSLGWATWIAASATVFGAVIASRLGGDPATRYRGPWRLAFATSAAIGALVAVALIALPARSAVRVDTFSPQVTAGGYAVVGLLLGLVVAYWAVASRPVAANLIATASWLWALAITAIVVELAAHRSSATYLTSWQFAESATGHRYGTIYWPSAALTLVAALVIGSLAAVPAVRRRDLGVGTATSGAVGPLLVAIAFFVLAPRLTSVLGPLGSAYLIAPYAVLAGLAGSVLAVALGRSAANRQDHRAAQEVQAVQSADPPAITATGVAVVPATEAFNPQPADLPPTSAQPAGAQPAGAGRPDLVGFVPSASGSPEPEFSASEKAQLKALGLSPAPAPAGQPKAAGSKSGRGRGSRNGSAEPVAGTLGAPSSESPAEPPQNRLSGPAQSGPAQSGANPTQANLSPVNLSTANPLHASSVETNSLEASSARSSDAQSAELAAKPRSRSLFGFKWRSKKSQGADEPNSGPPSTDDLADPSAMPSTPASSAAPAKESNLDLSSANPAGASAAAVRPAADGANGTAADGVTAVPAQAGRPRSAVPPKATPPKAPPQARSARASATRAAKAASGSGTPTQAPPVPGAEPAPAITPSTGPSPRPAPVPSPESTIGPTPAARRPAPRPTRAVTPSPASASAPTQAPAPAPSPATRRPIGQPTPVKRVDSPSQVDAAGRPLTGDRFADGAADPEIAAAARRSRRPTSGDDASARSTVTPPPDSPTVALINVDSPDEG